jgi:hypothetical protein
VSGYYYVRNFGEDPGSSALYTVGIDRAQPNAWGSTWEPESDHPSEESASQRVHYLNGGTDFSKDVYAKLETLEAIVSELKSAVYRISDELSQHINE